MMDTPTFEALNEFRAMLSRRYDYFTPEGRATTQREFAEELQRMGVTREEFDHKFWDYYSAATKSPSFQEGS